jgi:hypothetical protein
LKERRAGDHHSLKLNISADTRHPGADLNKAILPPGSAIAKYQSLRTLLKLCECCIFNYLSGDFLCRYCHTIFSKLLTWIHFWMYRAGEADVIA